MVGSKYTLQMEVVGNTDRALAQIAEGINRVAVSVDKLNSMSQKGSQQMGDIASATKLSAFLQLSDRINATSESFQNFTRSVIGGSQAIVQSIIKDAATFEDAEASMRFAFGANWESMYQKTLAESAKLTFTFEQTLGLASSLGRLKINPFGTTGEDLAVFRSKTGGMVSALEIIQDSADAAGRDVDRMVFGLREALTDDWKSLRDTLDLSKKDVKEWKAELAKAGDQQGKYNKLIELMGERFGGAGALRAKNFNKVLAQIPDLLMQIRAGIGRAGLSIITESLGDVVKFLSELSKDKELLASIGEGFKVIAQAIAFVIRGATQIARWFSQLLKAAPFLPALAAGIVVIGIAFLVSATAAFTLAAALATVIAGLMIIGIKAAIVAGLITLTMLPIVFIIGTLLFGAIAVVVGLLAAGAQIISSNWGGVGSFFEKLKITFTALKELISSYNGETGKMSTETAAALQKSGMTGFVQDVFNIFHKLSTAFNSFKDTISKIGDALAPTFIPMMRELKALFFELLTTFGLMDAKSAANESSTQDWADAGRALADALIDILRGIIFIIRVGVAIVRVANEFGILKFIAVGLAVTIGVLVGLFALLGIIGAVAVIAIVAPILLAAFALLFMAKQIETLLIKMGLLKEAVIKIPGVGKGGLFDELWGDPAKPKKAAENVQDLSSDLAGLKDKADIAKASGVTIEEYDAAKGEEAARRDEAVRALAAQGGGKVSFSALYERGLAPGPEAGGGPPMPIPSAPGVPGVPGMGEGGKDQVAAINKVNGSIGKLASSLSSQTINVNIDGKKVAEAIKGLQDGSDGG